MKGPSAAAAGGLDARSSKRSNHTGHG